MVPLLFVRDELRVKSEELRVKSQKLKAKSHNTQEAPCGASYVVIGYFTMIFFPLQM